MLVGLQCSDKFPNVPTKVALLGRRTLKKDYWGGGGGGLSPALPPATLMVGNAKEADIWFGRESAREARSKFKDLVCLVVFLCWIKRFVLLSLCLKCKYMNRYFSSFQKSRGGRSPPEKFEGGTRPPRPSPPRDRRLCSPQSQMFQKPIRLPRLSDRAGWGLQNFYTEFWNELIMQIYANLFKINKKCYFSIFLADFDSVCFIW